ncbi:unnamed protein product, partial [Prorocentrum cordatum]
MAAAPASAKSFRHAELKKIMDRPGNLKAIRESRTLCVALDHLALGRTRAAADALSLRLQAVDMAERVGWDRARHIELIPPESEGLAGKEMNCVATGEADLDRRLGEKSANSSSAGAWSLPKSGFSGKGPGADIGKRKSKVKGTREWGGWAWKSSNQKGKGWEASRGIQRTAALDSPTRFGQLYRRFVEQASQHEHRSEFDVTCRVDAGRTLNLIIEAVINFVFSPDAPLILSDVVDDLQCRKMSYSGESVTRRRGLQCKLVIPCWPSIGEARLLPMEQFVDGEIRDDILEPTGCLLPRELWPATTKKSAVFAADDEWYAIVKAGVQRNMFGQIELKDEFTGADGLRVLGGAMGVDKTKIRDGVATPCLRFVCAFTSTIEFCRRLRGGADYLPYLNQLGLVLLSCGEMLVVDSEDMTSCFNLFRMPDAWAKFFAFSKPVPRSYFGGPAHEMVHVYFKAVPMGWMGELYESDGLLARAASESDPHGVFVNTCGIFGIPLAIGKRLVPSFRTAILGGELDGTRGVLLHSREKGFRLLAKPAGLMTMESWTEAALHHWSVLYGFGAGFRRPAFSTLQDVISWIHDPAWGKHAAQSPPPEVVDEILASAGLAPLLFGDLRASIRTIISCSDASEAGGAASEARAFVPAIGASVAA